MKKFIVFFVVSFMLFNFSEAQKVAFIQTDTVLAHLPEMQEAQRKLNSFLVQAQQEIQRLDKEYQEKVNDYQKSKDTLNEFIAKRKLQEIEEANKRLQDFQVKAQAEYLQMQKDLLQPIQDKFNAAIKKIAKQKGYSAVIQVTPQIIYYDPKYDITDLVIKELTKK